MTKKYQPPRKVRFTSDRGASKKYQPQKIEKKWQKRWAKTGLYEVDLDKVKKPFYNLMMFPYPSGEGLHVGNIYAFAGSDIYGRFMRMQGFDVFEPIGLDGFGVHSENYAIKIGKHPVTLAKESEGRFYEQLRVIGNGFSWETKLETYDSSYYKWTQWIFTQMFKNGLVERKKAFVNWCPSCKTVLSDEQVETGRCERCKTEVVQKETEQWFFKITKYAERLLKNLDCLPADVYGRDKPIGKEAQKAGINWSKRIKTIQRNWIGKGEGINIEYEIEGSREKLVCFTTRPDTNFGATFVVLAPEHPLVSKITKLEYKQKVSEYVKLSQKRTELERITEERKKTGVFTGSYCINDLNGNKMPIWVSDFVIYSVGTGAVVGVPGHDKRDFEFAQKFNLPIIRVVVGSDGDTSPITRIEQVQEEEGTMVNSNFLNGLDIHEATQKIMDYLEEKGWGKRTVTYKLRDWCISRQRYWGPPIPMIYCPKCAKKGIGEKEGMLGWFTVSEVELPVVLPFVKDYQPKGKGVSPLGQVKDWLKVKCPKCGGAARRETDVSDTFLDSAWYFFRYPSVDFSGKIFDKKRNKKWLPVDMYIGGAEHSVLHLMYTRFLTMAFKDMGLIDFGEPFKRFFAHGLIIKSGAKMSKSRGNVVIPDDYIKEYGADTLRMYLMFLGPFEAGGDFRDEGVAGMYRFLNRVCRLVNQPSIINHQSSVAKRFTHQTIKKVTKDVSTLNYNTAIARIMEYVNLLYKQKSVSRQTLKVLILLLAPFAPHLCEELWFTLNPKLQTLHPNYSVHTQPWPKYDPELIKEEKVTIVIQVNGKLRDKFEIEPGTTQNVVIKFALQSKKVQKHLSAKKIKRTIFVKNRLVNFVV